MAMTSPEWSKDEVERPRLILWDHPYNPGDAIKCIDYPGARAETHRLRQLVSRKVSHLGDLVVRLPLFAAKHAGSQKEHQVVLQWLGIHTDEAVFNHLQARFFQNLPP